MGHRLHLINWHRFYASYELILYVIPCVRHIFPKRMQSVWLSVFCYHGQKCIRFDAQVLTTARSLLESAQQINLDLFLCGQQQEARQSLDCVLPHASHEYAFHPQCHPILGRPVQTP